MDRLRSPSVEVVRKKREESPLKFAKPARPPQQGQGPLAEPPFGGRPERARRRGTGEDSLVEREEQELEKFFDSALELYEFLKSSKVKMDLTELVECADGSMDQKRFKMHVAPNRAKTGMRYARLLRGLFKEQRLEVNPFLDRDEPFEKLNCLGYMELLVQKEVGRRTPQAFLYGVDFFAKAFGFSMGGSHIDRAKRLALRYAQLHTIDRKGAPMFNRAFMHTLERMVLDPLLNTPQRIVAGKLRICIQASIRHDDLTSTPLAACEWVRRRGEVGIVGLRARAWKGKTHARA